MSGRDSKSQVELWDVDQVAFGQVFYDWLVAHQRAELLILLLAPGPELWHSFDVEYVASSRTFARRARVYCTDARVLNCSFQKLKLRNNEVCDLFLQHSQRFLERWDQALVDAQRAVMMDCSQTPLSLKSHVHVRIKGLSGMCLAVGLPRSHEVGRFMTITGTVIRAGKVKLVERQRELKARKFAFEPVLFRSFI